MQRLLYTIWGLLILFVLSCKKSDNSPTNSDFTSVSIDSAYVLPVYLKLHAITGSNQSGNIGDVFQEQSICTDEALIPANRGVGWSDNGYEALFTHKWHSWDPEFPTLWNFSYDIINLANMNIHLISIDVVGQDSLTKEPVSELKALRSLGYYYLIDFFGNVPILTTYDTTNLQLENNRNFNSGRKELFDTIVNTITTNLPFLSPDFNNTTFGTFNKWTAFALLSKMYINAEIWTGTPMFDECIAVCDSIINSGLFSLSPDYFSNFKQANENSTENIFVIPYKPESTEPYEGFYYMSLHYNSYLKYQTIGQASNEFCALPDHYHSFEANDIRRNGWSAGPQFEANSTTPLQLIGAPYAGQALNFTPDFIDIYDTIHPYNDGTINYTNALENNGARLVKYEIVPELTNTCIGVPLAIFRYADVIMLKAEAIMRKNAMNANAEAVELVNQIRARAGVSLYTTTTLTMDEILAERGREFYYEGIRRQDLVRFGKFVRGTWGRNFSGPYQSQWCDRSGEGFYSNVYPIPYGLIYLNLNLTQTYGY
jgi:starch-binding outer membrane protein, SusD/RagB family